ncbi:MAG: zf-HC2 domain-containing protein [Specibacter sp.]
MNAQEFDPPTSADPYALWDGAYVLGALAPRERREYEDHVAGCPACRAQVAALSGLPGLLAAAGEASLSPATDPAPAPAYAIFARKVRRRRALLTGAAAAAVLALVAGTGGLALNAGRESNAPQAGGVHTGAPGSVGTPVPLTFVGTGAPAGLTAVGTLVPEPWGTRLMWTCTYAGYSGVAGNGEPADYELVAISPTGTGTVVGSWQATPGETVDPVASTSLPSSAIARLVIRRAGSTDALLEAAL